MGDLAACQASLERHFDELASARAGGRVFALEHGLDQAARADLARELRVCAQRQPSEAHWLAWTVYAAEMGYEYAGREYWQTFEEKTEGWRRNGGRPWIRECFQRFADRFNGVRPEGPWAEHFSIICWPIVHAILPRDLQSRVARILWDIRHSFTPSTLGDPRCLGALIATRGWVGSARLEQLADDVEIIGRIALALLFLESGRGAVPLLPSSVERIASDLEQQRHARDWLNDARASARGVALKGLRPLPRVERVIDPPTTTTAAREVLDQLGVQPSVCLSPGQEGWLVVLRIPSLAPLVTRFPDLGDCLTNSRPTVVGSSGEPLARQRLLEGDAQVRLRTWPRSADVLLRFEDAPKVLDLLLSAECLLRPGPTWLFRIGSDKIAYELKGRLVRPGHDYVLLSDAIRPTAGLELTQESIACDGISAFRLRVPASTNDAHIEALRGLGLSVARSIHVRPAGLAAAGWDGDGYGEWLAGERPCVALSSDHDVESVSCTLANAGPIVIDGSAMRGGAQVFLEFSELAVGSHVARFDLKTRSGDAQSGEMELLIRERRHWAPGLTHDGALVATVDPPSPTLEELWSDRATIDLHGALDQVVECRVRFWRRSDRAVLHETRVAAMPLPVTRRQWSAQFRSACRMEEKCQNAYDQADSMTLDFVSAGVGRFELSAEREFAPLRWVVQHTKQRYMLRLQDDRGVENAPRLTRYAFELPATATDLVSTEFGGEAAAADGGLYVARTELQSKAIVVAPRRFSLQGVRDPHVDGLQRDADAILRHLETISLWTRARQVGSGFSLRLAVRAVGALVSALFGALGGEQWAQLESGGLNDLRGAIGHASLGRELSDDWTAYARLPTERRVDRFEQTLASEAVSSTARRSGADPRDRIAEVALRFASDPGGIGVWAESERRLRGMVQRLLHEPIAARAARFLVLGLERNLSGDEPGQAGLRHSTWEWT
jgi:hypothetical protein